MYKSFILTITIAMLSSVAYCDLIKCDESASGFCSAFCKETIDEFEEASCGLEDCSGTPLVEGDEPYENCVSESQS